MALTYRQALACIASPVAGLRAGRAVVHNRPPALLKRLDNAPRSGYYHFMWHYNGQGRPPFAEEPGPGQESVWDYPRPPALVSCDSLVEVFTGGRALASTRSAWRVLETASPPTYYLPPGDVDWSQLLRIPNRSHCEWKGQASYWALAGDAAGTPVAWSYEGPVERFAPIDGHVSFYPGRIACHVDGERVLPQPGEFYGGWVTGAVVGPFKGEPGTGHW